MKMKRIIFFPLLTIFLTGCESITDVITIDSYSKNNIESTSGYVFPQGSYYSYEFSSLYDVIDPAVEISRLIDKGIIVNHAWYRIHRNGCGSGNFTTHTMYKSVFIVCINTEEPKILNENYQNLSSYVKIPCGQIVLHYQLN